VPARVPVHAEWEPAGDGATIEPVAAVLPSSVPAMLERAETLLTTVDGDDVGIVIRELADAFDGRTEILRDLNRAAADLGETLVDGIPEFERLIDSSGPVLAVLRDHRDALGESFTHSADVSETLADNRPTLDAIVTDSRAALRQGDALVRNERANVSCLVGDLLTLNEVFSQDEQLDQLARLLDLNRYFYGGFDAGTQWDPYRPGMIWARVNLLLFEEPGGRSFVPRRETPPTLPGAACASPFGPGVDAVRQHDPPPQPPDPTSPGIDYAPLAGDGPDERRDPDDRPQQREADDRPAGDAPLAALAPSEPLPQTGAHAAVVLGVLALATATALRTRR
jgi:ABC-type transporter Mla subunit MlaD